MKNFNKIAPWLIVVLIILWITLTESPYQKGGVSALYIRSIAGFVLLISILITSCFKRFQLFERLIVAAVFAIASLLVISIYIMIPLIDKFYEDKTWYFRETKHRVIINTVYYGLVASLMAISIWGYFRLRLFIAARRKRTQ